MIKAVVYDMDGMLFNEPHFFTKELEVRYGIELKDSLFSKDEKYDACKRGEITLDDFLQPYYQRWIQYPNFDLSLEEVKKEWFDFTQIQQPVVQVAKNLRKRGILCIIATNNVQEGLNI